MSLDRDAILHRFTAWLDEALAAEEPPRGIPEEILAADEAEAPGCDLYSVQAALTALTQEVKLQGRSFKQLSEAVAPVLESQAAAARSEAQSEARREVIDALLDLNDRLARGLDSADQAAQVLASRPRRWPWGSAPRARELDIVDALRQGYALTAARLREILAEFDLHEIDCQGLVFDARSMQAVDTEESAAAAAGTVVAVYRRGYEWNGSLYRPAQVRVARKENHV